MNNLIILFVVIISTFSACNNDKDTNPRVIFPGNDPNFTIIAHTDVGFTNTNRKVDVFGIPIYAYSNVEDSKLLHTANLMAQYLDNNDVESAWKVLLLK